MGLIFLISSTSRLHVAYHLLQSPTLILWNLLPLLAMILLLYFLSGRALFSVLLVNLVWVLLAVSDKIKISMRQEPLLPTDLTLVQEVMAILKTFPTSQILLILLGILCGLAVLVFAFARSSNPRPSLKTRLIGLCVLAAAGFGLNTAVYADTGLYDGYPVIDNPYFQVNQYNSRGLVYSFFHQANIARIQPPEGYSASAYDALEAEESTAIDSTRLPHVIMIMGEAYSDLSENEHISFEGYTDPMENFRALCQKENAVSGHIVVANFGGGTSNTEYDALTGLSTRFLDTALPSYNFIRHEIDALPYRLAQAGYDTLSIHPGYAWFYNRQNVYPDMGFDECLFLENAFDLATQGLGGYVNEEATMDMILDTFEEHLAESDAPLFSFTVTIQNHGPYEGKYGTLEPNFSTDVELSDTETDLLTQYFYGMADADEQIGRLVDYAQASDEPVVLVYFGDHLPGFSNGTAFFDLLDYPMDTNGSPEEQTAVYETPFVIWANDSAEELCGFSENAAAAALPENGLISASYLGGLTAELIGAKDLSPLFSFTNELRRELPVLSDMYSIDANGNYMTELSAEQQEKLELLIGWQYYKLFDQSLPTSAKE
ncbi:LTA synthase family protein [Anaerotignum lactatifermentans]|uniref:LTA synthase family protein n=2 Tax=Anaerotignum lactatifermentans TaxID=160404 RepID=A0ABS2G8D3_9FIRM|nr:LTA synthase family protein [Anaerotignum lactatifermentans]MBM6877023.1 LTA synthase family protein [Anaerotignum lactatifermentans]